MPRPFEGKVSLDIRDSKPDWDAFLDAQAPNEAPNVLVILYDDTGQAAWSPYGGRIEMPTLDRLAKNGLTYTQWHTTSVCSPTRSTFWIGKNHNVPVDAFDMGSSKERWPLGLGYDRFYGFIGGETDQWYPELIEDNHFIDQPYGPEAGYHVSKDLADKAIAYIRDTKQSKPNKPWYMWFSMR